MVEEADFAEKEEIVRAISILHIDHGLPNPTSVEKVILSTVSLEVQGLGNDISLFRYGRTFRSAEPEISCKQCQTTGCIEMPAPETKRIEATCPQVAVLIFAQLSPEDGTSPPSCERAEQKAFLLSALESLEVLGVVRDREFYAVLMTHFVEGDVDVKLVFTWFTSARANDAPVLRKF